MTLTSDSTGAKIFALTSGGGSVPSVSIATGQSSASFFYGDTKAASPTITASGALTSATQTETITAATSTRSGQLTITDARGNATQMTITAKATGYADIAIQVKS